MDNKISMIDSESFKKIKEAEMKLFGKQITIKPMPTIEPLEDLINKPSHYHKGGIDVIGFAKLHYSKEELKGFFRINCIKYIDRYDQKGGLQDLEKAEFYLAKLMELEK